MSEPGLAGDADGLVTDAPGLAVLGRSADCPLVLVAGRRGDGTRGGGFRPRLLARHRCAASPRPWSTRPARRSGRGSGHHHAPRIAPSAGPCCYEVGDEVRDEALTAWARTPRGSSRASASAGTSTSGRRTWRSSLPAACRRPDLGLRRLHHLPGRPLLELAGAGRGRRPLRGAHRHRSRRRLARQHHLLRPNRALGDQTHEIGARGQRPAGVVAAAPDHPVPRRPRTARPRPWRDAGLPGRRPRGEIGGAVQLELDPVAGLNGLGAAASNRTAAGEGSCTRIAPVRASGRRAVGQDVVYRRGPGEPGAVSWAATACSTVVYGTSHDAASARREPELGLRQRGRHPPAHRHRAVVARLGREGAQQGGHQGAVVPLGDAVGGHAVPPGRTDRPPRDRPRGRAGRTPWRGRSRARLTPPPEFRPAPSQRARPAAGAPPARGEVAAHVEPVVVPRRAATP